jgi:glycosyltransferase involved in cell wall biosynthesis
LVIGDGLKENLLRDPELKNLEFIGKKSFKEIPEILAKCHLGLGLLTDDEIGKTAIPTKVYEYIGSGIPSIVSPIGESSDFIIDKTVGVNYSE